MTDSPVSLWQRLLQAVRRILVRRPPVAGPRGTRPLKDEERLDAAVAEFQQRLLAEALRDVGGVGGIPFEEGNEETAFLAHPGRVVCRATSDESDPLAGFFRERREDYVEPVERTRLFGDLVRYDLPTRSDAKAHDIVRLLDEIDEAVGRGVAYPDHVVHVTGPIGGGKLCPATEPELPLGKGPVPARTSNEKAGRGIKVSVVDTGWHQDAADNGETPWLDDDVYPIEGDPETVDPTDIGSYVGHGTFVAGVIRCLAPATDLEIEGVLKYAGAVYESDIAAELNEAMADVEEGQLPKLISISAGTYTRNNAGMLAFELLAAAYRMGLEDDGPLVVAAAGNEDTNRKFYPAAYDWVVGVGALDENLHAASFSNYGADWVDVWAHGTNLVNAFPVGTYYVKEPGPAQGEQRDFTGTAQWSGTSFATPIVTGAIAALMSETPGMTARQAKQELFANHSRSFSSTPKVAKGIAVGPPFV